jgi:hypothetical protein
VFGFISGSGFNIDVGVLSTSDKNNIFDAILRTENVKLITDQSDDELIKKLEHGKIDALLNIKDRRWNASVHY